MSRRKRIDTVLRVAELRERAARIDLTASQSAHVAAQAASRARFIELQALQVLRSSSAAGLRAAQQRAALRAEAASEAEQAEATAREHVDRAFEQWQSAAQHEKAMESLLAHQREAEEHERLRQEQRLLDDLGALWSRTEWEDE